MFRRRSQARALLAARLRCIPWPSTLPSPARAPLASSLMPLSFCSFRRFQKSGHLILTQTLGSPIQGPQNRNPLIYGNSHGFCIAGLFRATETVNSACSTGFFQNPKADATHNHWGSSMMSDAPDAKKSGDVKVTVPMVNVVQLRLCLSFTCAVWVSVPVSE